MSAERSKLLGDADFFALDDEGDAITEYHVREHIGSEVCTVQA